ncbi:MAG: UTP--glucose-1-phosphate uridylyltransferase, partial [Gemmataceae bacterium]
QVRYFQQGTMPAVDLATGRLLLDSPGKPFLAPDGHGGCLSALENQGHLAWMQERGIRSVFYFQVDNPLVKVADPNFLGRHLRAESQASSKVVPKRSAGEKVGVFVSIAGRCHLVEYSDLPQRMAEDRQPDGSLRYAAGSPAIHLFSVDFLRRVATGSGAEGLPFHVARKKVPHIDTTTGARAVPATENALKFERFIFDALPQADRWLLVGVTHEGEFAPL